jgi:hypothetical protein
MMKKRQKEIQMSRYIELNVNGRTVETKPYMEMTVSAMEKMSQLDDKNEFYEMAKAMHILRSCLVDASDWELFESMTVPEFTEIVSEWTEMQSGSLL